jgi:hypothetical protein
MNKIGTALTIFNNNGFEAAFKEAQKYTGYLTDEDRALLSQLDASVKAKEEAFTKTIAKFAANGLKVLTLTNTKSGKNTSYICHGLSVCRFKSCKQFWSAARFHIIIVHGQEFQQLFSLLQRMPYLFGNLRSGELIVLFQDFHKVIIPAIVL